MKAVVALMVLLAACAASAQSYPSKPIRLVVGFAPGGAADIIARAMSDPLTRALGQGIIVDNKPGAGSSLAAEYVAKVAPDGYTIMIARFRGHHAGDELAARGRGPSLATGQVDS